MPLRALQSNSVGWRVLIWGPESRTDTLAASVVEKLQLNYPVWYRKAFVSLVLPKSSCRVLEFSLLDDRNRQWLDFKGFPTSGKMLKWPQSTLTGYSSRAQRRRRIYREVEGLGEVKQWTFFIFKHTNLTPLKRDCRVLNNPDKRNRNVFE